jgi:two-component system, LuxR family, sensor kinase FixL
MSSMSTIEGASSVGTQEPRRSASARRATVAWVLRMLDLPLPARLRGSTGAERDRGRLIVAALLLLLLCDALFLVTYAPLQHSPRSYVVIGVVCAGVYLCSLGLLHGFQSTRPSALLLCGMLTGGFVLSSLSTRESTAGTHAFCMLVPLLSVYLLGPRLGLVFTLVTCLDVALLLPLRSGLGQITWARNLSTAFCLVSAWALTCLLLTARDYAHKALERALRSLREHERKLTSLLENTEDVVCSVDVQGRLIAANPALVDLYRELFGHEPEPGQPLFSSNTPESYLRQWAWCQGQIAAGKRVRFESSPSRLKRPCVLDISLNPVVDLTGRVVGMTIFGRDITERKQAETKLGEMHRSLLDVSRQAGMAEIATGVLHNVGNALNSVNVSVNLLAERMHQSRVPAGLVRTTDLLSEHSTDLGTFLTQDPRGQRLPEYLRALGERLADERAEQRDEMTTLLKSLEHIKSVVSMQQEHARFSGVVERLEVTGLLDDALRLQALSLERVGILVRREYTEGIFVRVDRHKLLQILLNLLSNARHALLEAGRPDKALTIRVERLGTERLRIAVADNGIGIAPENAPRLFTQGFTTKKDGHGFGLHISALAAAEMDAYLSCASEGRGRGATFTIELPVSGEESRV